MKSLKDRRKSLVIENRGDNPRKLEDQSNTQKLKVPERENGDIKECIIKETTQGNFEELKIQVFKLRSPAECQTQ